MLFCIFTFDLLFFDYENTLHVGGPPVKRNSQKSNMIGGLPRNAASILAGSSGLDSAGRISRLSGEDSRNRG